MKTTRLGHEFVEYMPEQVNEGILYISTRFATAIHSCCCGCGSEVVTPLSPTDWQLTFDGESVSLQPSIGNWSFDCQSHYWIRRSRVVPAGRWSREKIEAERARRRNGKTATTVGAPAPRAGDDAVRGGQLRGVWSWAERQWRARKRGR
jgi:hypothetical protein